MSRFFCLFIILPNFQIIFTNFIPNSSYIPLKMVIFPKNATFNLLKLFFNNNIFSLCFRRQNIPFFMYKYHWKIGSILRILCFLKFYNINIYFWVSFSSHSGQIVEKYTILGHFFIFHKLLRMKRILIDEMGKIMCFFWVTECCFDTF